jgi:hypothetical protein
MAWTTIVRMTGDPYLVGPTLRGSSNAVTVRCQSEGITAERNNQPPAAQPDATKLLEHGHYTNKQGKTVHSPAHSKTGEVLLGACAQC